MFQQLDSISANVSVSCGLDQLTTAINDDEYQLAVHDNEKIYIGTLDDKGNQIKDCLIQPQTDDKQGVILRIEFVYLNDTLYLVVVSTKLVKIYFTRNYKNFFSCNLNTTKTTSIQTIHSIEIINDALCIGTPTKLHFFTILGNNIQPKDTQDFKLNSRSLIYKIIPFEATNFVLVESLGTVTVWKLDGKNFHFNKASSIKIHPNTKATCAKIFKQNIILTTISGQIQIVDLDSGLLICEIQAHMKCITSVDFEPETGYLISSSEDSFVRIFRIDTNTEDYKVEYLHQINITNEIICGVKFFNKKLFAVCSYENSFVKLFELKE